MNKIRLLKLGFPFFMAMLISVFGFSQPFIGYYLSNTSEPSKGRNFEFIEESYELVIKGVTTLPHRIEKRFNSQGKIISELVYGKTGGKTSETQWEYFGGTKLTLKYHKFFVNMVGWQEELIKIDYNTENGMPKEIVLEKNGKLFQWAIIGSDSLNRVETAKVLDARKAHIFSENLLYIESSNMIKVMVYRSNGQFFGTWSYRWDENKPYNYSTLKRKFNANGDVMIETLSSGGMGDQAYFYDYTYDAQGNWITKETYQVVLGSGDRIKKKKLEHRIARKITYQ